MARSRASALAVVDPDPASARTPPPRIVISPREAAIMAGYSEHSMQRKMLEPDFPKCIRYSCRKIAFYRDEIEAWIASKQDA